jgi:hypothetical protein
MDWKEGRDRDREGGERMHTDRQAGRKRRKDAKKKYAGLERWRERWRGGEGERQNACKQAGRN